MGNIISSGAEISEKKDSHPEREKRRIFDMRLVIRTMERLEKKSPLRRSQKTRSYL